MNAKRAAGYEIPAVAILLFFFVVLSLLPGVSAQSSNYKLLFDETRLNDRSDGGYYNQISETDWYGGSDFADALKDEGYSVSTISTKPITYDKLKSYDIFVMLSNGDDYSDNEVDAIERFVENGGGLFLVRVNWRGKSASTDFATNKVAQRFGVSFAKNGQICDATDHFGTEKRYRDVPVISVIESHAVTDGISSFYCLGTYIKDTGASKVLAYSDSDAWFDDLWDEYEGGWGNLEEDIDEISGPFPVLSVMDYGQGKIVFFGDGGLFRNCWLDRLDDKQLGLNIVDWLAVPATGTIKVRSDPSGAAIYLDGVYEGTTPATIFNVKVGFYDIKLKESGYEDWRDFVRLEAGKTKVVDATLKNLYPAHIILLIILSLAIIFTVFFVFRGSRKAEERRKQVDYEQKIADYKSKLEHWEKEGYDVSKLKEKWFK